MNVLVTGGYGYVGRRLVPFLESKVYKVRVLDVGLFTEEKHRRAGDFIGDIRNRETVREAMQGMDSVVHLAAISSDDTGCIDESLTRQVNFDAVGLLLQEAKRAGVRRFINASSSSVFGPKTEASVTEELEPEPVSLYSKYKALSETLVTSAASDKFCTVNIRPATICGYSMRPRLDLVVNKMTCDALNAGVISVWGGEQRRPNIGMLDIITIYELMLRSKESLINGETFNAGFENHKVIDLARLIQAECNKRGKEVAIEVVPHNDIRDYHINSDKLQRWLKYTPVSSIAREISEFHVPRNWDADVNYNAKCFNLRRLSVWK